jgi:hypothetical protein
MRAKYPITALVLAVIAGCSSNPKTDDAAVENDAEAVAPGVQGPSQASASDSDVTAQVPSNKQSRAHGKR